jgi:hypothetical protein
MLFSVGGAMGAPKKHQQAIEKHAKTDCINRFLVLSRGTYCSTYRE